MSNFDYKALRRYITYVIVGAAVTGIAGHEAADVIAERYNFSAAFEYTLEGILTAAGIVTGIKLGSILYDALDFYNNRKKKE